MPSLIYIARITGFSDDLMEELRSSGLHVKAFGPGEITADDCLLVMTSEAILASLPPTHSASGAGTEPGAKGLPPLREMNAQLGSQADIWPIIKTEAPHEPAASPAQPCLVASAVESDAEAQPRRRALAAPEHKSAETSGISPAKDLPRAGKIRSVFGSVTRKRYNLIWRPIAAAAALLFFALILLTHRASTPRWTRNEMAGDTNQSTPSDRGAKDSGAPPTLSSTEAASAGARQHHSAYDFVAEDFTNHFATQGHGKPSVPNPEFKRNAQGSPNRKRIVVN
jgi:hypothetical protein